MQINWRIQADKILERSNARQFWSKSAKSNESLVHGQRDRAHALSDFFRPESTVVIRIDEFYNKKLLDYWKKKNTWKNCITLEAKMPIKGAILLFQEHSQPRINGSAWVNWLLFLSQWSVKCIWEVSMWWNLFKSLWQVLRMKHFFWWTWL